jgi:glutathione S-transferase
MAATCVAALEEILGGNAYFAGPVVSLADLCAISHLDFFAQTPEGADMLAGSPLLGWMERMNERPSVRNTTWSKVEEAVAA